MNAFNFSINGTTYIIIPEYIFPQPPHMTQFQHITKELIYLGVAISFCLKFYNLFMLITKYKSGNTQNILMSIIGIFTTCIFLTYVIAFNIKPFIITNCTNIFLDCISVGLMIYFMKNPVKRTVNVMPTDHQNVGFSKAQIIQLIQILKLVMNPPVMPPQEDLQNTENLDIEKSITKNSNKYYNLND